MSECLVIVYLGESRTSLYQSVVLRTEDVVCVCWGEQGGVKEGCVSV